MNRDDVPKRRPGRRILIVGTGGQGVLTAARLLCHCFVDRGHNVVSGQLHGMAQRGGAVQSSVIIDAGISPVIPSGGADFVLGFEPVETARTLPFLSNGTVVYMNTAPVIPFVLAQQVVHKQEDIRYPDVQHLVERVRDVAPRTLAFDAAQRAVEAGSFRSLNIVMLGCLLGSGLLTCPADAFWSAVEKRLPQPLREVNARAFWSGVECAAALRVGGAVP